MIPEDDYRSYFQETCYTCYFFCKNIVYKNIEAQTC